MAIYQEPGKQVPKKSFNSSEVFGRISMSNFSFLRSLLWVVGGRVQDDNHP